MLLARYILKPSIKPNIRTLNRTLATMSNSLTDHNKWKFNHTMLRVKDPKRSLEYYKFLGLTQINKLENPDNKFDLYFLGGPISAVCPFSCAVTLTSLAAYDGKESANAGNHWSDREGVLELTHNYGTESDDSYKVANGNSDPGKGFGHVCISVDNIQAACQRIEGAGYKFQKKLTDGRMRHIAFALDPDGYWVEIIGQKPLEETENVKETETSSYRFNHSMIRVKDADASLKFYQEVMGMTLMKTTENPDNKFNLYFLGYPGGYDYKTSANGVNPVAGKEGILELTWNYGTEKQEGKVYHDGNSEPQVSIQQLTLNVWMLMLRRVLDISASPSTILIRPASSWTRKVSHGRRN